MISINENGKINLESTTQYDFINANGKVKCNGDLKSHCFSANGKIKINGDLIVSTEVNICGKAKINNLFCTNFSGIGGLDIKSISSINASITISNDCQIENITSSTIKITKKNSSLIEEKIANTILNLAGINFDYASHKEHIRLIANTIKGKFIVIDNVTANYIIGEEVIIGANCNIKHLQYKNSVSIDDTSTVYDKKKNEEINF